MEKSNKLNELELLILESVSMNESACEFLELLSEELDLNYCLNVVRPSVVTH